MDKTLYSISKALMDVAANARVVLHQSAAAREALAGKDLGVSQRRLLERIDGVKSLEQLFAASADIIGVHAVLGNLLTSGFVSTEAFADKQTPVGTKTPATAAAPPAPALEKAKEDGVNATAPAKPGAAGMPATAKATPAPTVIAPPVATPVAATLATPAAAPVASVETAREPNHAADVKPAPSPQTGAAKEVEKKGTQAEGAKAAAAEFDRKKPEVATGDAANVPPPHFADAAQKIPPAPPAAAGAGQHAVLTPAKPVSVTASAEPATAAKAAPDIAPPQVKSAPPTTANAPFSPTKGAKDEVDAARKLMTFEAKHLLGADAGRLQPRIDACRNIEDIYDLIVKFQQHLVKTGKGDPDVFLDRLTKGLELARKEMRNETRSAA